MQKLSSDMVDHVKAKLPAKPTTEEREALSKAKARLAGHGSALTPDKREARSTDPEGTELPLQEETKPKPFEKAEQKKPLQKM